MIERAIAARVPFRWVAADTVYDIERDLRPCWQGLCARRRLSPRLPIVDEAAFDRWSRFADREGSPTIRLEASVGWGGSKRTTLASVALPRTGDLEAQELHDENKGLWTRGLLIRRTIADGDLAFFTTWQPAGTSIKTLVGVEGRRWAIEDSFEIAKNEFGLDHNETRSWHGWRRHVSPVMSPLR